MEWEFNEHSEGENPVMNYNLDWNNVKTVEDLVSVLKGPMTMFIIDYSKINEEEHAYLEGLIKKGILK